MTLTRIQGQGHRDPKVAKSPKFIVYLLRQSALAEVDRQSPYGANFHDIALWENFRVSVVSKLASAYIKCLKLFLVFLSTVV